MGSKHARALQGSPCLRKTEHQYLPIHVRQLSRRLSVPHKVAGGRASSLPVTDTGNDKLHLTVWYSSDLAGHHCVSAELKQVSSYANSPKNTSFLSNGIFCYHSELSLFCKISIKKINKFVSLSLAAELLASSLVCISPATFPLAGQ